MIGRLRFRQTKNTYIFAYPASSKQVYRLHQLNRAAQLVTALGFSIRGVEATSQTVAISNSLGALLAVLQILGVICIWSLSSFLMRFLPPVGSDASSRSQQLFS